MQKLIVIVIGVGALHIINALWMWLWPENWYLTVPGVTATGPFNMHFVRDIALIFLVSGSGLIWSALRGPIALGLWAAMWPCLHALFHIWIWAGRGAPFDFVALSNLLGIQLPAWLALISITLLIKKDTDR
ncbi:hypothetical protein [Falsiphaeobacter marinintestinus]|uniref:hypothetical protein n=1 Tax=Falsiphaeobacter marinintestinus TaxID=1492905 RepID=UPI0011B37157|nr:hypothetical protein [Phaeobacter marinintestinus]